MERYEIWFILAIIFFLLSILAIYAAFWLKKNQVVRDPRWDNTYPCLACKQGEMIEIVQLTEHKCRYICTNCGAEEIVEFNKEMF